MKIGFTASCFDMGPHAGHVMMLKEARSKCDYLIVALQVDPSADRPQKNKPVQSVSERFLAVRACKYVDEVIPYQSEAELEQLIQLLRPNIRFLGEDYVGKEFTGKHIEGVEIHYCNRKHTVSSSGLRQKVINHDIAKKIRESTEGI